MSNWCIKSHGSGSYANITSPSDLSPGEADFTYCAWFRQNTILAMNFFTLQDFAGGTVLLSPAIEKVTTYGLVSVQFTVYTDEEVNTGLITGATHIQTGDWHHIATTGVKGSLTGLKVYLDGVLEIGPLDISGWAVSDLQIDRARIGEINLANSDTDIDDGRFYGGVALTQSQIQAIYNSGAGVKVNETDFAAITNNGWYSNFDDGTGTVFSGRKLVNGVWSASNGTFHGNVTWQSGGVPFNAVSTGMAFVDELTEMWAW